MISLHQIVITAFVYEVDDEEKVAKGLKTLVPIDLEQAKLSITRQKATGFFDRPIYVLSLAVSKKPHVDAALQQLLSILTPEDKKMLLEQGESRLDKDLHFFLRLDKDSWMNKGEAQVVDHGRCFHYNMTFACFPKNREKGLELVKELFGK